MTHAVIQEHFGTPLSQVPKTIVPFKFKKWQKITLIAISLLAIYGAYSIRKDFLNAFNQARKQKNQTTKDTAD